MSLISLVKPFGKEGQFSVEQEDDIFVLNCVGSFICLR